MSDAADAEKSMEARIAALRDQHEREMAILHERYAHEIAMHTRIVKAEAEPGSVKITLTFESKRTAAESEATMAALVPLLQHGIDAYIRSLGGAEPQSSPPTDPLPDLDDLTPWYSHARAVEIGTTTGEVFIDAVLNAAIEAFDRGPDSDVDSDDYAAFVRAYLGEREAEFIRFIMREGTATVVRLSRLGATPQFIAKLAALLGPAYAPSSGDDALVDGSDGGSSAPPTSGDGSAPPVSS